MLSLPEKFWVTLEVISCILNWYGPESHVAHLNVCHTDLPCGENLRSNLKKKSLPFCHSPNGSFDARLPIAREVSRDFWKATESPNSCRRCVLHNCYSSLELRALEPSLIFWCSPKWSMGMWIWTFFSFTPVPWLQQWSLDRWPLWRPVRGAEAGVQTLPLLWQR